MDPVQVVASVAAGLVALAIGLVAVGVGLVAGLGPALVASGVLIGTAATWAVRLLLRELEPPSPKQLRAAERERGKP